MQLKKSTNPVFNLLVKLKLISKNKMKFFYPRTRDNKSLATYIHTDDNSLFLQRFSRKFAEEFYAFKNYKNDVINDIKINNKTITLNKYFDDNERRYHQFKKYLINKDILDFGCGYGDFLSLIKKNNVSKSITGVEIRKDCIKKLNKLKIKNVKSLNDNDYKFDVIFLFHVIEHLPNPIVILKQLKKRLKKNGILVIETPSCNDFLLKFENLKNFKNFILWSEHIVLFSKKLLNNVLCFSGFEKNNVVNYQRYGLNNHLGWLSNESPGYEKKFNMFINKKIDQKYVNFLKKNDLTDTIISISKNI